MRAIIIYLILCCNIMFAGSKDNGKLFLAWGGGAFQGISFHTGTTSENGNNAPNNSANTTGKIIGVSIGVNYLPLNSFEENIVLGVRMRYLHSQGIIDTHSLGFNLYLHFIWEEALIDIVPLFYTPSIVLGAGAITEATRNGVNYVVGGSYVEVGVAFFKAIPLNVELLYRATFLNNPHLLGVNDVLHSMNVVFTIF